jgi:RND family efflux transporter MFP subunit
VADLSVSKLRQGMNLTLTTEALPGVEFKGWLTRIAASADSRTRVFEVELTIPKPPSQLRAGMIASLVVPDANATAKPVVVVPLNAVVSHPRQAGKEDSYTVVVVTGDKNNAIARRRTVKLGEAFGNLIAISEGLEAGESVVTLGAATVNDGERVQVIQ